MTCSLALQMVGDESTEWNVEIPAGDACIGRDPDAGIVIPFAAISREHARIARFGNHWFFKDLQSTNGSWLNGLTVSADEWVLIRDHDYIQLADRVFRVYCNETALQADERPTQPRVSLNTHGLSLNKQSSRSLILFCDGVFNQQIALPDEGKKLSLGGVGADVSLRSQSSEQAGVIIEQIQDVLVAYSRETESKSTLNGELLLDKTLLSDRDVIHTGRYSIIINDQPVLHQSALGSGFSSGSGGTRTDLRSWMESQQQEDSSTHDSNATQRLDNMGLDEEATFSSEPELNSFSDMNELDLNDRATIMYSHSNNDDTLLSLNAWDSSERDSSGSLGRRPTLSSHFGRLIVDDPDGVDDDSGVLYGSALRKKNQSASMNGVRYGSFDERMLVFLGIFLLLLLFVIAVWWILLN
ncbi:FHA domain-containing protein [bacterium]|nr:FHA domain-containing protein [bacterium]